MDADTIDALRVVWRAELPQVVDVVRLADPALRVLSAKRDQRLGELRGEQQEAEQRGVRRVVGRPR